MVVEVELGGGLKWARKPYLSPRWIRSELILFQRESVVGKGGIGIPLVRGCFLSEEYATARNQNHLMRRLEEDQVERGEPSRTP